MILLNTHARTGSYLAYQLILNNLRLTNTVDKEDVKSIGEQILNTVWGTDLPTPFNHIKNPIEPFAGISLADNPYEYTLEHPFGNNYQEISDEFFSLLEKGKRLPITNANVWDEDKYVKPKILKEKYGYKVFTLYRRNIKEWFVSINLAFTAGVETFHAIDDSSADYILNRRKSLVGKVKVDEIFMNAVKLSMEKYIFNSIPHTDGWVAYEDLVNEPQKFIETVGLDTTKQVDLDRLLTRKIEQPVNDITEYYEDPNEFDRVWNKVWTNTKK
tara:strand:- start:1150 stop:1965 length:816 start_codon:yes stop_codon:yes gene_type:complete